MAPRYCLLVLLAALAVGAPPASAQTLTPVGTYRTGIYNESAAEIVAYDVASRRLFFVSAAENSVTALDVSDPAQPTLAFKIALDAYGAGANSVAVSPLGMIAVAVEARPVQEPGKVVLFTTAGEFVGEATVGALPDALAFTPDGLTVVVACEGEPSGDYTVDPEGTVGVVRLSVPAGGGRPSIATVDLVRFTDFNVGGPRAAEITADPSILIFGPGSENGRASVAQDLEPEYVAISPDGRKAYVTLQENNAIAVIDVATARVDRIFGLGFKDHSLPRNAFDASDQDGGVNIRTWPVFGRYEPDALAAFEQDGVTYLVTANEGDARAYAAFDDEPRLSTLPLDPAVFPNAAVLQANAALGRLRVSRVLGDTNGDGLIDRILAFGARSFSVWRADTGAQVYDSGDDFERITAERYPTRFNASNSNNTFDNRSPAKGPEPEAVAIGTVDGRRYAFVGLERIGGVMVYDLTDPAAPRFVDYVNNRNFEAANSTPEAGDLGVEDLVFIPAAESPNGQHLLVSSNEVSGTITLFAFTPPAPSAAEGGAASGGLAVRAFPNPASGSARLTLTLAADARVDVELTDALGRVVARFPATDVAAGEGRGLVLPLEGVAPGVYFARVQAVSAAGTHGATVRLSVVR